LALGDHVPARGDKRDRIKRETRGNLLDIQKLLLIEGFWKLKFAPQLTRFGEHGAY
jgi:hypothetical protein